MLRLKEKYLNEVAPALMEKWRFRNSRKSLSIWV